MSNRETKKQRKIKEHNRIKTKKNKIKELEELKKKAVDLEQEISIQKKKNFKHRSIRNLKVFGYTCNFLAPFVLCTGITVGAFALFGGGLPFHTDEVVKYKKYSLEHQTNGYTIMDESYRTNFDSSLSENELTIYTPWEFKDNQYIRYKREYDIGELTTLDLYDAVLDKNYEYITKNIKDYKEEMQIADSVEETEGQDYFFIASLHMLDKEDAMGYKETDLKNIIITIVEIVLGLGIGSLIAYFRDFEYIWELEYLNKDYKYKIKSVKPLEQQLNSVNKKILSLTQKGRK